MEIEVKGLDGLLKKLDKLGGNIEQSTQKALLKGGAVFESGAKEHCPVDTGQLRESIHTEAKDAQTVTVGTNCGHAVFVEYGTGPKGDPSVPHTTKKSWRYQDAEGNWHTSHGQPPQPFMRETFAAKKDKVVD
ncbi:MAG: HK97 gp10 family phage protein, partial [Oscillospiraceae bacterium]|nr:HK97 gp10 family phage protein [Oscillospiraceae bacterium]